MEAGILQGGSLLIRFAAPLTVVSNQPVFATDTLSLRRQVVSQNVQRWEIVTRLEPSNQSADFLVHSVTNGHNQVFSVRMPQVYRRSDATNSAGITLTANAASNANQVQVQNLGFIARGEFIRFSNHSKVYMVTEDLTGNGNLKIFPRLRQAVPIGSTVFYGSNAVLEVRYEPDVSLGITYTDGILSDPGTVTLVEALA